MKVNIKRNGSHHLSCLSGLSQAPLIGGGENGNERSTPISAQALIHQSPNRIALNQESQHQQQRAICGTPQMTNSASASNRAIQNSSIFFPKLTPRTSSKSHMTLDLKSTFKQSTAQSNNASIMNNLNLNMNSETLTSVDNDVDEHYHLYHEPVDLDEQEVITDVTTDTQMPKNEFNKHNGPSLTPNLFATSINSPVDWNANQSPRLLQMTPTERSPNLILEHESKSNNSKKSTRPNTRQTGPFSDRATSFRNEVEDDVYFRYVHLKSTERANHRSSSYHGPKNFCSPQMRDDQSLLKSEQVQKRNFINSSSVTELQPSEISTPPIIPFRDHCVRELVETESNYVHALEMIITCFAKPLEVFLRHDDNQLIFGNIRNFHHIHSVFQADLVKAAFRLFNKDLPSLPSPTRNLSKQQAMCSNPTTPTLVGNNPFLNASPLSSPTTAANGNRGDPSSLTNLGRTLKISTCFLNAREKFLKYGEYCASLSKAQMLLDELTSKNEAISAQLDRCQQEANEGKFKLRDLLSLPMQRILKYHLLLAQLIKNTSSSNADYQGLKRAHETMVDLGQYINEVKRDTEAMQIMNEIEQSIVGLNMPTNTRLIDYGRLITDGFVRVKAPLRESKPGHELSKIKLSAHDTKMRPKRYVFVFDKVMLVCKLSGLRRYQYKEALVLSEFELESNPIVSSDTLSKHTTKEKWSFTFNLIRCNDGTIYTFFAKTSDMKQKWINSIQRAMDNTRPSACRSSNSNASGHDFLMHTFDKASSCNYCGKLLLGLYYQGYRCRICFTSLHKKCLALVRPCGPSLPPKTNVTIVRSKTQRPRCNEPPSPSVKSIGSENSGHFFMQFPGPNSKSVQHMDAIVNNNEYNGMETKSSIEGIMGASTSFRENGAHASGTGTMAQRPVSSMINVSLQNSTNQIIQQKRLLKSSTSVGNMHRTKSKCVRAIEEFDGNEEDDELTLVMGDVVLLNSDSSNDLNNFELASSEMDKAMLELNLNTSKLGFNDQVKWFKGKNLRTGLEGRFPRSVVENIPCENDVDGSSTIDTCFETETDQLQLQQARNSQTTTESYVNFPLSDQPWFNDRMDRDKAQALLEDLPHGTFLVRVSPKHQNSYVISLKYNNKVMHMRVYVAKDNQLYLSQNRYFNSLVELVSWYEKNSLIESFNMLDACLAYPYKFCTSC